jgi:hypothetical protein
MRIEAFLRHDSRTPTGENPIMSLVAPTPASSPVRRVLLAPFTRRAWAEFRYAIVSLPVGIAGFVVTAMTFAHPMLVFVSTPVARAFGSVNRQVLRRLLGERVPPPPPMRPEAHLHVKTPDAAGLTGLVAGAGGQVQQQNAG